MTGGGRASARKKSKPPAKPRIAGGRLVDGITAQLREMILDHTIAPGTVLLQNEWSERLQVSRTPLREAFRILERDGLVRVSNGNRTIEVVHFASREHELRGLYEVREVLDGLAARLLANAGLQDETALELDSLLEEMDEAAQPFDSSRWFSAHMAFHVRIAESCGNSRLRQQLDLIRMTSLSLHAYLGELSSAGDRLADMLTTAAKQHHAIVAAIRSGNGDLAEMAACQHIRTVLDSDLIEGAAGLLKPSTD
ncbi:GntR family transcriptional regulator [Mycolicibacterium elephantis]|uniref:GntR family transcriptional regulator n=1 Tax=Mycolicibacterium elephantis TaxID=81858 RepID=UPI0013F4CB15|nr:GntR family transcriptional regulator [Mycolicibacterium elephantis]